MPFFFLSHWQHFRKHAHIWVDKGRSILNWNDAISKQLHGDDDDDNNSNNHNENNNSNNQKTICRHFGRKQFLYSNMLEYLCILVRTHVWTIRRLSKTKKKCSNNFRTKMDKLGILVSISVCLCVCLSVCVCVRCAHSVWRW